MKNGRIMRTQLMVKLNIILILGNICVLMSKLRLRKLATNIIDAVKYPPLPLTPPPVAGVLTATGGFESAETPARASTGLAEGSGIVGSRAHGSGVVTIDDHTTTATPRQSLCAPLVDGVLTAKDVFKSFAAPSGHSNILTEGSGALLLWGFPWGKPYILTST